MTTSYYGIDLHSTNFFWHQIIGSGKNEKRNSGRCPLNKLGKFKKHLSKEDYLCLESSCGSFEFISRTKDFIREAIAIHAIDFKHLYLSGKKTDSIDSHKLAERLKYYIETERTDKDFPKVYIPEEKVRQLRELVSYHEFLKEAITAKKNQIHSRLRAKLITVKCRDIIKEMDKNLNKYKQLDDIDKKIIKGLVSNGQNELAEKEKIEAEIEKFGVENFENDIKILISIDGISLFTAAVIMSDIGTIKRFKTSKEFCSYLRSVPTVDSSNRTVHIGKTKKRGRHGSYNMILQGLEHIKRQNTAYKEFYDKKIKGKTKGKVRGALVRKTLTAIFYMLKNETIWNYRS